MTFKQLGGCYTSHMVKEMQINILLRYHFIYHPGKSLTRLWGNRLSSTMLVKYQFFLQEMVLHVSKDVCVNLLAELFFWITFAYLPLSTPYTHSYAWAMTYMWSSEDSFQMSSLLSPTEFWGFELRPSGLAASIFIS